MHRLLKRQLQRIYGKPLDLGTLSEREKNLVDVVSAAYEEYDRERKFVQYSLSMHVEELAQSEKALKQLNEELETRVAQRTQELENAKVRAEHAQARAELAAEVKSAFLANMSHEIRTPMNAILGMTELALRNGLDARNHNYVSKAKTAAENLLGIIDDILDFSKIEEGKLKLEPVPTRLVDVLKNVVMVTRQKATEKQIRLSVHLDQEVPDSLLCDPLRLGQVLINLVSNAIKFSHDGGVVRLLISLLHDGDKSARVRFAVADNGIGIAQEQLEKLFQPFTQADNSTTRRYGGTGLGLVISRNIVQSMGSDISVDTEPGAGSTFAFSLDLAKVAAQPQAIDPSAAAGAPDHERALAGLRGLHLLLVDDNAFNQELAVDMLRSQGLSVEVANNGLEALQRLETESFDGVLMDCQMPVMDGYEATRKIRAQARFSELPIIALTASTLQGDKEKVLAAGMNDHIAKPIDFVQMFATLSRWFAPNV